MLSSVAIRGAILIREKLVGGCVVVEILFSRICRNEIVRIAVRRCWVTSHPIREGKLRKVDNTINLDKVGQTILPVFSRPFAMI